MQTSDVTFPVAPSGEADRVRVERVPDRRPQPIRCRPSSWLVLGMTDADIIGQSHCRGGARECRVVREAVHDSRQVGRTFRSAVDSRTVRSTATTTTATCSRMLTNTSRRRTTRTTTDTTRKADKGTLLTIRAGTGNNVAPSFYFSWAIPPGTGGSWYRDNIAGCPTNNSYLSHFGDFLTASRATWSDPTTQGIDDLIAQDPNATWDTRQQQGEQPAGRS